MSQVQPPRERPSNARPAAIQMLRWSILNLGALAVTLLLVRIAVVTVTSDPTQASLKALVRVTRYIVWPLSLVPPLTTSIGGGCTFAELLTLVIVLSVWIGALGVVAGWEREGQRLGPSTNEARLKP